MNSIKIDLETFIKEIDNLRNIDRYQTVPRVLHETVAEHSFFVAAYVLKLHDKYDFNLEKALSIALMHDFSECYITDVIHPVKEKYPKIAEALSEAEYSENEKHLNSEYAKAIDQMNNEEDVPETLIVNLADILSVYSYATDEKQFSNNSYIDVVIKNAENRSLKIKQKLQKYMKKGEVDAEYELLHNKEANDYIARKVDESIIKHAEEMLKKE